MFLELLLFRVGHKTTSVNEDTTRILGYLPTFEHDQSKLCKIDSSGQVKYHQFINDFLEMIRSSSLYDPEYVKHLEHYTPKPFDKIAEMDYPALRALFTMLTQGETLSGKKDYVCIVLKKGIILKMLNRLRELSN